MTPSAAPSLTVAPVFDLERVLGSIDSMAAQRPVAAQVVAETNSDRTSAQELSRLLGADEVRSFLQDAMQAVPDSTRGSCPTYPT